MREARDRAELLLREVNHRVANSLALVAALVAHAGHRPLTDGRASALDETQARITAIAGIHRRLYTSDDVRFVEIDAYLASLVEELEAAMKAARPARIAIRARGRADPRADRQGGVGRRDRHRARHQRLQIRLSGRAARGEIRVKLHARAGAARTRPTDRLTVEDDGVGWQGAGPARGTGLGSRIIRAMATNLNGGLEFDEAYSGTRATFRFSI